MEFQNINRSFRHKSFSRKSNAPSTNQSNTKMSGAATVSRCHNHNYNQSWEEEFFVAPFGDACTCLICGHVFTSNKKFNIRRHFHRYHVEYDESFPKKTAARKDRIAALKSTVPKEKPSTASTELINDVAYSTTVLSFKIAFVLAKALKPFEDGVIAKQIITTAAQELLTDSQFKDSFLAKIEDVPLSRNTMARRIKGISNDVNDQLVKDLQKCRSLSLQLDESNDASDTVQLCIYLRMAFDDCGVTEEFLSIVRLKGKTTDKDTLTALKNSLKESGVPLNKIVSMTTDGASTMVGRDTGLLELCRRDPDFPAFATFHCVVNQLSLCANSLDAMHVTEPVTKILNTIRSNNKSRQPKLFRSLLEEADCNEVLLHPEVRWLNRGKLLDRFYEALPEIRQFLESKKENYDQLENQAWSQDLAFLTDLTKLINGLDSEFQEKNIFIWTYASKINCFREKLSMWIDLFISNKVPTVFDKLKKITLESDQLNGEHFASYLRTIYEEFNNRFKDFTDIGIIAKYFNAPYSVVDSAEIASTIVKLFPDIDETTIRLEMIDLRHDDKPRFLESMNGSHIESFWRNIDRTKYENLITVLVRLLSCTGTSYSCKKIFSKVKHVKSRLRSRLTDDNLDSLLRISVSEYKPDFQKLSETTQSQVSH